VNQKGDSPCRSQKERALEFMSGNGGIRVLGAPPIHTSLPLAVES